MEGRITVVQRMSVHDGPGIRTTVFLKGCNMRCPWCHNPETWSRSFQLQLLPDKCIHCHQCIASCEHHAWSLQETGLEGTPRVPDAGRIPENSPEGGTRTTPHLDRALCRLDGHCAAACFAEAIVKVGENTTADRLMETILADRGYYRQSGGGVTLSGGEPLLQADFARELLERCRAHSIPTAIETNFSVNWEGIAPLLPYVDLWICDLKLADNARHLQWTGIGNRAILANLQCLADRSIPVVVRTPVIPGVNDCPEDIAAICDLVKGWANVVCYELIPFHPLGTAKYAGLGMPNCFPDDIALARDRWTQLRRIPSSKGIPTDVSALRKILPALV